MLETSQINQKFYESFLFRQSKFHISLNVSGQWVELSCRTDTFRKLFCIFTILRIIFLHVHDKYMF